MRTALLIGLAAIPALASANNSQLIVQDRLVDMLGTPICEPVTLEFRLYAGEDGTDELPWSESHHVEPQLGDYTLTLGAQTPLPENLLASGSQFYVGRSVNGGADLMPRRSLSSIVVADLRTPAAFPPSPGQACPAETLKVSAWCVGPVAAPTASINMARPSQGMLVATVN